MVAPQAAHGAVMGLTGFACLVAAGVITLVDPHRSHAGRETVAFVGGALLLGSYAFDSRLRRRPRSR
jgi:hypothetical protein